MTASEVPAEQLRAIERLAHRMSHAVFASICDETGGECAAAIMMVAAHYLKQWSNPGEAPKMLCQAADYLMDSAAQFPVGRPQ